MNLFYKESKSEFFSGLGGGGTSVSNFFNKESFRP